MKKTSKLFGAVALSAALAMGTVVPAFAEVDPDAANPTSGTATTVVDATKADAATGANTTVTVDTYISQISVALPMTLPVYAQVGGGTGKAPTNYYIENLSKTNIQMSSISWSVTDTAKTNWNLLPGSNPSTLISGTSPSATVNAGGTDPEVGTLGLTLTPRAKGSVNIGTADAPNNVTNAGEGNPVYIVGTATDSYAGENTNAAALGWKIDASTSASTVVTAGSGSKMYIDVTAASSALKKSLQTAQPDVIKIMYTVAPQK